MRRILLSVIVLTTAVAIGAIADASAAEAQPAQPTVEAEPAAKADPKIHIFGFLAAAFSVGVSVIGASWAVAKVGTAAMGAVAEKPELMGRSMVYVGLAEGLAIYGLIVAIMILGRLG